MNEKKSDYVKNEVINNETLLECSGTETIFKNIFINSLTKDCENEIEKVKKEYKLNDLTN